MRIEGIHADIRNILTRPGEKTTGEFFERVSQLSGLDELSWQLGLICPVAYAHTYPVEERFVDKKKDKIIFDEARRLLRADFKLFLNGHEVRRQISLPSYSPSKLREDAAGDLVQKRGLGFEVRCFKAPGKAPVFYQGYLVVQASQVFPEDVRGLLIRLRGTAIGWHRTFNIATAGLSTMLPSLSGEVWVDGLEEALQFDRESFREDHPDFRWLRDQLINIISGEAPAFRQRSAKRKGKEKASKSRKGSKAAKPAQAAAEAKPQATPAAAAYPTDSFLPASIFEAQKAYLKRLVPQINGCWSSGYHEACAVMARRMIETMIIELYYQRGWMNELKDPTTKDFYGLKTLVNKICSDSRFGFDSKFQKGLKALKELGDIAAHDYRVKIKKSDLEGARSDLRFTCERMVFEISGGPKTSP